mmetsp:Transcript_8565/g.18263  ORF Transcript_8565/g.18263 Transcript_8565/m.18263 type:complete len:220 (-) Transcript_8565:132-791(-)
MGMGGRVGVPVVVVVVVVVSADRQGCRIGSGIGRRGISVEERRFPLPWQQFIAIAIAIATIIIFTIAIVIVIIFITIAVFHLVRLHQLRSLIAIRLGSVQLQKSLPRPPLLSATHRSLTARRSSTAIGTAGHGRHVQMTHRPIGTLDDGRTAAAIATAAPGRFGGRIPLLDLSHGRRAGLVGHPPHFADVEAQPGAGHLEVRPDAVGVHGVEASDVLLR